MAPLPQPRTLHLTICATLLTAVAAIGVSAVAQATATTQEAHPVAVTIRDVAGKPVGTLALRPEGYTKSRLSVTVKGLPPGYHGFHIHATGICDPAAVDPATGKVSPFYTAGGHFDLGGSTHSHHSGDLPPLLVAADGSGTASVVTDRFRVRQLTDADGSAVIVHALPDNLANIPERYSATGPDEATQRTGDAGGRIACGPIK
ncbi:superoxide dismutase family protein [Nonomuraea sp. NPDC059023]|uniref:superoxide dismutase family protein n=1 Tax=unclassified Nonomuraea TaxID=2593643 RepID=UPI00369140DA